MHNGKCLRRGFRRQLFVRALKISGLRFGKRSAGAAARLDAAVPALLCERDAQVENQFAFRLKAFAVYRRNRVCAAAGSKRAPAEHEHFAGGGDRILKREPVHVQHGEVSAGDQKPVQLRRQRAVVEAGAALAGRDGIKAAGGKAGLLGGRAEKADVYVLFPRERLSAADLVFGNIGPGECCAAARRCPCRC